MSKTNLFVGSLDFDTTENDLQQVFSEYGAIKSCKVITDRETGRSRGFGFVEFDSPEAAANAVSSLDGTQLGRRTINVSVAKERESSGGGRGRDDRGNQSRGRW